MTFTPDYVEQRVWELYDEIHARKIFEDNAVEPRTRSYTIHSANDPMLASVSSEDEPITETAMDFEEIEIPIERQYSEMTPEMHENQDNPWDYFETQWVTSFTNPIHRVVDEEIGTHDLTVDSYNEIPFEAFHEGRYAVMEQHYCDPMTMLVSDRLAEEILEDSVFDDWDIIERDMNEEFGVDVFRDRFNALYGNEILFLDRDNLGYEFHAREPYVEERGLSIRAHARTGYCITNPDVAIRLQVAV